MTIQELNKLLALIIDKIEISKEGEHLYFEEGNFHIDHFKSCFRFNCNGEIHRSKIPFNLLRHIRKAIKIKEDAKK